YSPLTSDARSLLKMPVPQVPTHPKRSDLAARRFELACGSLKEKAAQRGSPLFSLLGEFDDACLADDGHFDLARILQFALNALGDIAGEDLGAAVVDRVGL